MKAEELMVGDWVYGCTDPYDQDEEQKKYPVKVIKIDINGDTWTIGNNPFTEPYEDEWWDLEPIPLTPEILEKNGWQLWDIEGEYKQMDSIVVFGRKAPFSVFDGIVINYVHELQHALRLCGINKTIEL